MNQKCIGKIQKIKDVFGEVEDALDHLEVIIENDEEDRIEEALDMFPRIAKVTKAVQELEMLLQQKPWESKGKK